jgi:hypothetical protein
MAANRSLARCPCIRLVWLLAHSEERGGLAPGKPLRDAAGCINVARRLHRRTLQAKPQMTLVVLKLWSKISTKALTVKHLLQFGWKLLDIKE